MKNIFLRELNNLSIVSQREVCESAAGIMMTHWFGPNSFIIFVVCCCLFLFYNDPDNVAVGARVL